MSDTAPAPAAAHKRRRLLTLLAAVVVVGAVLYGIYALVFSGHTVETDNAYVGADTAQVTPLVAGPVAQVLVRETEIVKAGQPLVILDDADARIAVAQAQAAVGQAERKVRGYEANDTALGGQLAARQADINRAQSDLQRARTDLDRRQALSASGAVSGEELTTAKNQFASAQAQVAQARANLQAAAGSRQANEVLISGTPLEQNPEVAAAQARLDAAKLALSRTVIRAPIDGVVSKKAVQIGQQAQVGTPLMAIVPTTEAYVDANFKEVQLTNVRIGQPVTLTSDLYGGGVKFHGRVKGLSGGTGSAFSLIPAQNASGNWIKVVQRLPVRIQLDPRELAQHPLRIGLSMKAAIDISNAR
ncbi:EmrA/EmrK family multidrug efflux transporter periplasmic adaptor subunit [Phenylobacterium hankyongense]|uniref:EmrA/EmrK family multidrug efflux transporter periplasmic adaptor subunit n=1 Tax=Phenylobacterium hankyongense TaxID=1813876 RepID=A0A328B650_9CAUL|nr:HlyD family efflux transporter periplasmic adaptor subunit [Phenylobacterium hankyongense]RAK60518.1 EmrA/EmrK family multidrug efflux transporter periplasmic adaptor subunit [Phenylobacterium hankyongense]